MQQGSFILRTWCMRSPFLMLLRAIAIPHDRRPSCMLLLSCLFLTAVVVLPVNPAPSPANGAIPSAPPLATALYCSIHNFPVIDQQRDQKGRQVLLLGALMLVVSSKPVQIAQLISHEALVCVLYACDGRLTVGLVLPRWRKKIRAAIRMVMVMVMCGFMRD
jgi:hypothetical protein